MKAYHNDPAVKQKYIDRLELHYKADEIIKGKYWENGKGCAVGCTVHSSRHLAYEEELGVPRILAKLEDGIFEGLPNDIAKEFPLRFLRAIPVGADLSMVFPKFMLWLLIDDQHGVWQHVSDRGKAAIENVATLYRRKIAGKEVTYQEWRDAAAAAYAADAAAYAAYAAAAAYAAYAAAAAAAAAAADAAAAAAADAAAAAYAAAAAADAAAYAADAAAAAAAAADAAARQKCRFIQADKLIELLRLAA